LLLRQEGFVSVEHSDPSREHTGRPTETSWRKLLPALGPGNLLTWVTLVTSLYTLLFLVRPTLRPRDEVGATIVKVQLEHNVALRDFLDYMSVSLYGNIDTDINGLAIYAQVDLHGFRDRVYAIWCEFLYADDETVVLPAHIDGFTEVQEAFSPQTASDRVVIRAWIAQPGHLIERRVGSRASLVPLTTKDRLVVRVKLYDLGSHAGCRSMQCGEPSRRLLDILDSRPFRLNPTLAAPGFR
jgi:hypothetical protein